MLKKTLDKMNLINYIIYRNKRGITMTQAIKISKKSLDEFKNKEKFREIVDIAYDFVRQSIHMDKVKDALDECLKKHPELLDSKFTDVIVARVLAQSVIYTIFGNKNAILWRHPRSRSEMDAMRKCASDMFYICKEHGV